MDKSQYLFSSFIGNRSLGSPSCLLNSMYWQRFSLKQSCPIGHWLLLAFQVIIDFNIAYLSFSSANIISARAPTHLTLCNVEICHNQRLWRIFHIIVVFPKNKASLTSWYKALNSRVRGPIWFNQCNVLVRHQRNSPPAVSLAPTGTLDYKR